MGLAGTEELREQIVAVSTLFWREEYDPGLKSVYERLLEQYAKKIQGLDSKILTDALVHCTRELEEQKALVDALDKLEDTGDAFANAVGRYTRLFDQLQALVGALEYSPVPTVVVVKKQPAQLPFL